MATQKGFTAVGLMSGTSIDGVDAALLRTDGVKILEHGPVAHLTYSGDNREVFEAAITAAEHWPGGPEPQPIYRAAALVSDTHARLVNRLLDSAGLEPHDIDFLGLHGQTILHQPKKGRTVQIGDAQALANLTGIDVIADFRLKDISEGGEGAPLTPFYHQAMVRSSSLDEPVAVVNIGGVANITYIDGDDILAFDTGPGNGLIDEWMADKTNRNFDEDGKVAALGTVDRHVLQTMLDNPWFYRKPPKSLDRYDFTGELVSRLSIEDGAATLTAFSAAAIAAGIDHLPGSPATWVVCGGGRHNKCLMEWLGTYLQTSVRTAEDVNWRGDDLEAEAFAFLAVRSYLGLPLSLPATTGVKAACSGGKLYEAQR